MKLEACFEEEMRGFARRLPLKGKAACKTVYRKNGDHRISVCSYPLEGVILQLCYSTSGVRGAQNALFSRFLFDGEDSLWRYLIYDLLGELAPGDFGCWQYPGLYSQATMRAAFEALTQRLLELLPNLLRLAGDPAALLRLRESKQAEIARFTKAEHYASLPMAQDPQLEQENVQLFDAWKETNSFCSPGYVLYLAGNRMGAIRRIRRLRFSTNYELRLAQYLESTPGVLPDPVGAGNLVREGLRMSRSKRPLGCVLLSWLLLMLPCTGIFLALYYGAGWVLFRGAVQVEGFALPAGLLAAQMSGLALAGAGAYFLWTRVFGWLYGKKHGEELAYYRSLERKREKTLMRRFAWVAACAGILLTLLFVHDGYAFYETGFSDNTRFFSLSGTWHPYEEVASIWKTDGAYTPSGSWQDAPSYVIRLKDGRVFDLYFYTMNQGVEERVAPILEAQCGVSLGQLHTAEDIPEQSK